MATEAQIQTTIADQVRILDEFLRYASVNTERFTGSTPTHEDTFRGNLQNDYFEYHDIVDGVARFREHIHLGIELAPSMLTPGFREYGKIIGVPERDPRAVIDRLYDHFIDNTERVTSRGFSAATPSAAGGNTGDGVLNRLNVDENNFVLENQTPDAKTAICIQDEHSGSVKHEEVFELRGEEAGFDSILLDGTVAAALRGGSGRRTLLKALSAADSLNFIANPSFDEVSGTPALPTDWTIDTPANATSVTTPTYRDFEGAGTSRALEITGDINVSQLFTTRRLTINPRIPLFAQVAVHKNTATAGTISFFIGNGGGVVMPINISTLSAGWNVLTVAGLTATANRDSWYKNIKKSLAPDVFVEVSNMGTGQSIYIDDVVVAPFTFFDGGWYALVGGATKFLRDDKFTFTDTSTEAGLIQKWLWRAFGLYLPHTTGTPVTWADPT